MNRSGVLIRAMRLAAPLTLLAACSPGETGEAPPAAEWISCALAGSPQFDEKCTIEQTTVAGRQIIVVRHPDGAFRRLELSPDGQSLHAADGAEQGQSVRKGDHFEVLLGPDRYSIPVRANAPDE